MASSLRLSTVAAFVSAVSGYAILGGFPTQTVGYGSPFLQLEPTQAPSMELVKKSLGKRALTNTCTEWSIEGGFGQPVCSNSQTCLFTVGSDGYYYEGCGETSIAYDWVTACYDYPMSGTPGISEIYCDATAPYCGYLAFQFGPSPTDATYSNFGCSTSAYSLYADLIVTLNSSDTTQTSSVTLAAGGTSQVTAVVTNTDIGGSLSSSAPVVIVGGGASSTAEPTPTQGGSSSGSSPRPAIGSHRRKKKAPIGGIVGGVIGGIVVLAILAIAIYFFIRKRRGSREEGAQNPVSQEQQQQPGMATNPAAYQSNNYTSVTGGMAKPAPDPAYAGAFVPQQQNGNEKLAAQQGNGYPFPNPSSPPPVYNQPPQQAYAQPNQQYAQASPPGQFAQPPPNSPYPPSNYTELESNQNLQPGSHASVGPVSPVGTYNSNASELGGSNVSNAGTYQPPAASQQVSQPPPNVAEMSGNAASPRPPRQNAGFDMNGAPLSEGYGHHELP